MGFLHSGPDEWKVNRLQLYLKHDTPLGLPEPEAGEYLIEWLAVDLDWCAVEGMGGLRPHSWSEIDAFDRQMGLGLEPWEARQIRGMSRAYVDGNSRGKEAMVKAPVYASQEEDPGIALERRILADKLKRGLGGLAKG